MVTKLTVDAPQVVLCPQPSDKLARLPDPPRNRKLCSRYR